MFFVSNVKTFSEYLLIDILLVCKKPEELLFQYWFSYKMVIDVNVSSAILFCWI